MSSEAGMPRTDEVMMRAVSACVSAPREASEVDDSGVPPGGTLGAMGCPWCPFARDRGTETRTWDRARARASRRALLSFAPFTVRSRKEGLQFMSVRLCAFARALCAYARQNARETF